MTPVVLFAATGPVLARYTRELLAWAMGDQLAYASQVSVTRLFVWVVGIIVRRHGRDRR
ncbi:MAG: hypothetical protein FWD11_02725 [Micrococcales bacterium]|nr:hypothetical protein [Micrococcales bacterium]